MLPHEPPPTVTVAEAVPCPPAELDAFKVYVVVCAGEIVCCPEGATEPIPGEILTVVASVVVQDKLVDCPGQIVLGVTVILPVTICACASFKSFKPAPKIAKKNKPTRISDPLLFFNIVFILFISAIFD